MKPGGHNFLVLRRNIDAHELRLPKVSGEVRARDDDLDKFPVRRDLGIRDSDNFFRSGEIEARGGER